MVFLMLLLAVITRDFRFMLRLPLRNLILFVVILSRKRLMVRLINPLKFR